LTELIHKSILATFMEDVVVIEAQQLRMESDHPDKREVAIAADAGALGARRILQRLIREQASKAILAHSVT
jgi:hypothetical protein